MTKAQIKEEVAKWAILLKLSEWDIKVAFPDKLQSDDLAGEAGFSPDYSHICISFNSNYKKWNKEFTEEVVIHELIHAHLNALWNAGLAVENELGETAKKFYKARLRHELEHVTENLTQAVKGINAKKV